MKSLCLDFGNTHVHWGEFQDSKLLSSGFALNNEFQLNDEFENIALASVIIIPVELFRALKKQNALVLNSETPLPIKLNYQNAKSLGADRIAAAVALYKRFPNQVAMSVDLGTCITYDILDDQGVYQGGAISPGIGMRSLAMNKYTAKLPKVELEFPPNVIGNSTQHSLQSGVMNAVKFEIEGMIEAVNEQFGSINTILTGGDADSFVQVLKNHIFADPNLVLKGLNEILAYNRA